MQTERLLLRPFVPDDLDSVHAWQSRPDVVRYLYGEVRSRDEVTEFLRLRARTTWPRVEGDVLGLAVVRRDSGEVIGDVNLGWLSARHRQGEIGFVFNPEHHGNGFATEAATAVLRLGFRVLGLHRVIGRCDARNTASAAVMERLGMRREAHFRHDEVFKGEWGDQYVYAVLDDEFP